VKGEGHLFSDNVFVGEGMVFGAKVGGKMEELRESLVTTEALEQQSVLSQGSVNSDESFLLDVCCHIYTLAWPLTSRFSCEPFLKPCALAMMFR
jgi:hypothetical protein